MQVPLNRGVNDVKEHLLKYSDYIGAGITVWCANAHHILSIDLLHNANTVQFIINIFNTVFLAFVGVGATEVAKYLIRRIRHYFK